MEYVLLLRGINVGKGPRVPMGELRDMLTHEDCSDVRSYINSGNAIFQSELGVDALTTRIYQAVSQNFGHDIPILVLTAAKISSIAQAVPEDWANDDAQKSDVAYLFPEIDRPDIIRELPMVRELMDIRYVPGALLWNVSRELQNKSRLNKLVGHKLYRYMTVRNVNTARYLASALGSNG